MAHQGFVSHREASCGRGGSSTWPDEGVHFTLSDIPYINGMVRSFNRHSMWSFIQIFDTATLMHSLQSWNPTQVIKEPYGETEWYLKILNSLRSLWTLVFSASLLSIHDYICVTRQIKIFWLNLLYYFLNRGLLYAKVAPCDRKC